MADRFFDTSAIAKHYRAEVGTPAVDSLLGEAGARHFISELSVVEFHSILARLVRTGQISAAESTLASGRFLADVAAGLWRVVLVTSGEFHRAKQLLALHGPGRSLRTLDAIQLAVALGLHSASPLDAFICADANLGHVAAAEGLSVVNPETP